MIIQLPRKRLLVLCIGALFSMESFAQLGIPVPPPSDKGDAVYRINAGADAVSFGNNTFAMDTHFDSGYVIDNYVYTGYNRAELYSSERFSLFNKGSFNYNFPIDDGEYIVVLHFAEIYHGAPGKRIMNVAIEGNPVLTDLDIIAEATFKYVPLIKEFRTTVTDGSLDLHFSASVDRPKISAIEIFKYLPCQETPGCELKTWYEDFDNDGIGVREWSVQSCCQPEGYVAVFGDSCPDDADQTFFGSCGCGFQLNPREIPQHRINAGGIYYNHTTGQRYVGDAYFDSGNQIINPTREVTGTDLDPLYLSERFSNADLKGFNYNLPVRNGRTKVVLHFAEIYFNAPGKRILSVKAEGHTVVKDLDIFAEVGSYTALVKTFEVPITDGVLNLEFSAKVNRPKITAIEVFYMTREFCQGCSGEFWYADFDGDGYGDPEVFLGRFCDSPDGYVTNEQDACPEDPLVWQSSDPCGTGTAISVASLSAGQRSLEESITVYPTLVDDKFTINTAAPLNLSIFDIFGKMVVNNKSLGSGAAVIAFGERAQGIYFAKLTDADGQTKTLKLIKK